MPGPLPPLIDGDRALVAGPGLACLELATGRVLWTDRAGAEITAPPVIAGARILTGEKDGTLRSRDRATGTPSWTRTIGGALLAPPLVDAARRRVYLGTTDKRIVEVKLGDGDEGWSWTVGADVADHGLLLPGRVLFASYDAVLYSLHFGGNLDWRAALPSRPLSGPILVNGDVVLACLENEIIAIAPESGRRAGDLPHTGRDPHAAALRRRPHRRRPARPLRGRVRSRGRADGAAPSRARAAVRPDGPYGRAAARDTARDGHAPTAAGVQRARG